MSRPMCLPWGARCLKTLQFVWDWKSIHPGKINTEHNEIGLHSFFQNKFKRLHPGKLTWNTIMKVWFRWCFVPCMGGKSHVQKAVHFPGGGGLKLPNKKLMAEIPWVLPGGFTWGGFGWHGALKLAENGLVGFRCSLCSEASCWF